MDLQNGLTRMFLASCLAQCAAGCAMSAVPAPSADRPAAAASARDLPVGIDGLRVAVSPGANDTYQIHVIDRAGREIQVIEDQDGRPPYVASELLKLEDYSGDGKPDILARGLSAGASALTSESIYVYDAKSGRFLDRETFRNEGEVTKVGNGCIEVEHRNPDNVSYSKDMYCWDGKWSLRSGPSADQTPSSQASETHSADPLEGDWYYGSDCDFGHYVTLGLRRSGRGYVGEWSDGTKVHGSDGLLRATPHGTQLQLAMCGQEARSGFPLCPKYENTTDVLELRGDHLVWRQGTGSYGHDYAVMHRQIGDKAEIERCTDEDDSNTGDAKTTGYVRFGAPYSVAELRPPQNPRFDFKLDRYRRAHAPVAGLAEER